MKIKLIVLVISFCLMTKDSLAHSGGLDDQGCHHNRKTGEYHCHRSPGWNTKNDTNSGNYKKDTSKDLQTIHIENYRQNNNNFN